MHNIQYWVEREDCNRSFVLENIEDYAKSEGDGYSGPVHWHDEVKPLESEDAAREWIKKHDRGWYDDHAVRFYDRTNVKTKKTEEFSEKIGKLWEQEKEYEAEHSIKKLKAEYIACKKCGSRLNRKMLRGERCPVCSEDLRSKTTIETLGNYERRRRELFKKIEDEQKKHPGMVKWLVKFEFHS